ncbi:polyprenyl synthetase protein (macronuclear) [Tetrahymena thermophila SB210]|uniref:Polyprenyl synthetase protein n=1 Tax=Tetrahymena thermophila (strain SB210) TaxID=312017 RepID=I7M185_TETTS|nr:polyprenyl synthetase protein [Tetrahymena thermophila SB210]EAR95693.2 polyprenyl synthetase protein [Tetrahymena thermophila SB210]|eukprot:XP_001015938.2 polyprenyl synthetase protein [Tetrahymena thermophila SB210]
MSDDQYVVVKLPKTLVSLGAIGLSLASIYLSYNSVKQSLKKISKQTKKTEQKKEEETETIKSEDFLKIFTDYGKKFNQCGALEAVIPRKFETEADLAILSDNLLYTKNQNDLVSLTKAISEPVWDLLDRGGKRWRPILCIILAEAFNLGQEDVKEIASLCEIVHNGTLVVDDIEDNSTVRRDKKCVHLIYGVDISINAGNMMYFAPLHILLKSNKYTDQQKLRFAKIYAEEMTQLHLGQGWDILWHNTDKLEGRIPTEQQYLQMTAHKTGVLARLSSRLICAAVNTSVEDEMTISRFSERIGVAFQIQDDILNLEGEEYKKTKGQSGEDIHEGKMSLIVLHSLQNSQPEDKDRLFKILSSHTDNQDEIDEAIALVKKTDSISYSRKVAQELVQTAWNDIENLLPASRSKQLLKLLAEYNIGRKI